MAWAQSGNIRGPQGPAGAAAVSSTVTGLVVGADNTAVLNSAIAAAPAGSTLIIPPGTWTHATTIQHAAPGVTVMGYGARLIGTDPVNAGYHITASWGAVRGLHHHVQGATARGTGQNLTDCPFSLDGATDFELRDVLSVGARDSAIFLFGAQRCTLVNVMGRDSQADGLHITYGSRDIAVHGVSMVNPGDDGVAVVSYTGDPAPCQNITVSRISVVNGQARGVSIVGGVNVEYYDFKVHRCRGAGVYVAHEGGTSPTRPVTGARIAGGAVYDSSWDTGLDSGFLQLVNQVSGTTMTDVQVLGVEAHDMRKGQNYSTVKTSGSTGTFTGCVLQDINTYGDPGTLYVDGGNSTTVVVGDFTYASATGNGFFATAEGFTISGAGIAAAGTTSAAPGLTVNRFRYGGSWNTPAPSPPRFRKHATTAQPMPVNTTTTVSLDTVDWDTTGSPAGVSGMTCSQVGTYAVRWGGLAFNLAAGTCSTYGWVTKNGVTAGASRIAPLTFTTNTNGLVVLGNSDEVYLNVGDTLVVSCFITQAQSTNLGGGLPFLSVRRVSD